MKKQSREDIVHFRNEIYYSHIIAQGTKASVNTIELHSVYEDESKIYILMDLCEGDTLLERCNTFGCMPEYMFAKVFQQMVSAVSYLHQMNVAHLDLKLENWVFCSTKPLDPGYMQLKLIDFGSAHLVSFNSARNKIVESDACIGTTYIWPPETVSDNLYSTDSDIWALGVCGYLMLFQHMIFVDDDHDDEKTEARILKGFDPTVKKGYGDHFPEQVPVSSEVRSLITRCLAYDRNNRPTARELLQSPFYVIYHDDIAIAALLANMMHIVGQKAIGVKYLIRSEIIKIVRRRGVL